MILCCSANVWFRDEEKSLKQTLRLIWHFSYKQKKRKTLGEGLAQILLKQTHISIGFLYIWFSGRRCGSVSLAAVLHFSLNTNRAAITSGASGQLFTSNPTEKTTSSREAFGRRSVHVSVNTSALCLCVIGGVDPVTLKSSENGAFRRTLKRKCENPPEERLDRRRSDGLFVVFDVWTPLRRIKKKTSRNFK